MENARVHASQPSSYVTFVNEVINQHHDLIPRAFSPLL